MLIKIKISRITLHPLLLHQTLTLDQTRHLSQLHLDLRPQLQLTLDLHPQHPQVLQTPDPRQQLQQTQLEGRQASQIHNLLRAKILVTLRRMKILNRKLKPQTILNFLTGLIQAQAPSQLEIKRNQILHSRISLTL